MEYLFSLTENCSCNHYICFTYIFMCMAYIFSLIFSKFRILFASLNFLITILITRIIDVRCLLFLVIVCEKQMCDLPDEVQKRGQANETAMQACVPFRVHHQVAQYQQGQSLSYLKQKKKMPSEFCILQLLIASMSYYWFVSSGMSSLQQRGFWRRIKELNDQNRRNSLLFAPFSSSP